MGFFSTERKVCVNCGSVTYPKMVTKGSIFIEILLWLCFLIPGLIYSVWRLTSRHEACPKCKAPNMVPVNSPKGKAIIEQIRRSN